MPVRACLLPTPCPVIYVVARAVAGAMIMTGLVGGTLSGSSIVTSSIVGDCVDYHYLLTDVRAEAQYQVGDGMCV